MDGAMERRGWMDRRGSAASTKLNIRLPQVQVQLEGHRIDMIQTATTMGGRGSRRGEEERDERASEPEIAAVTIIIIY